MASKAQMEIMGLVIIVILISMGVLFALRFSLSDQKSNLREQVVESELAAHILNAMLSTTTNCTNKNLITIAELYQDCALSNRVRCDSGRDACEEAQNVTKLILDKTLEIWGKSYRFKIDGAVSDTAKTELNITNKGGCGRQYERKTIPLPTGVGTALIQLDICK